MYNINNWLPDCPPWKIAMQPAAPQFTYSFAANPSIDVISIQQHNRMSVLIRAQQGIFVSSDHNYLFCHYFHLPLISLYAFCTKSLFFLPFATNNGLHGIAITPAETPPCGPIPEATLPALGDVPGPIITVYLQSPRLNGLLTRNSQPEPPLEPLSLRGGWKPRANGMAVGISILSSPLSFFWVFVLCHRVSMDFAGVASGSIVHTYEEHYGFILPLCYGKFTHKRF